mgnify:CR=1 FL=1
MLLLGCAFVNAGIKFILEVENEKGKFDRTEYYYEHGVADYIAEITSYEDLENIFKKANYSYEIGGRTSKAKETQINVHTSRHLKTTRIILSSADDFFERILRETVKDSIKNKLDMVELMISLNAPSCEYAYEIAKKCPTSTGGARELRRLVEQDIQNLISDKIISGTKKGASLALEFDGKSFFIKELITS